MIITCEACNTSFNLDDKMLKPTGSKVRCSVCTKVFTAFPQQAPVPESSVERVEPDTAPATKTGPESDLVAAAGLASMPTDTLASAEPVDAHTPETDVIEEDAGLLFADGSDLDFALEDEPDDGASASEIEDAVSDVLNDDLDLDLPFEPAADEDGITSIIDNLDEDELDLSLDGQSEVAETVIADLDQEDFGLDVSPLTDGDPEGTDTIIANLDDDALDLENDLSFEPDGAVEPEALADDALPETLDDLDGLDDLDLTLDMSDVGDAQLEPVVESPELEDDLDLSSLESLLKDDEESEDDTVTMVVDEGEGPELVLDMDAETPASETDSIGGPAETLEDLALDLDGDGKTETLDIDAGEDFDQEIDLSEIEKMLEEPESASAKFSSVPEQDLDLDIEASLETEKWMSEAGDDGQLVMDEDLDLSELEQVLEDVDTDAPDDTPEDQELELDLGDGETLGTPTETVAIDNELDFDLSDFEDDVPATSAAGAASRESVDMELEFEAEADNQAAQTLEDEGLEETVAMAEPRAENVEVAKPRPVVAVTPPRRPQPVKKGLSKSLIFALILAILGGGGYGTYYLLNQNGIDIPFLSDYLKPKVQDPGNLKLTTYDINSKFVDNYSVGKLFVVSGQVKNGYSENRGMITLEGKIFSTGKVPVNQEKVYCGNVMSDLELANLEWDKIKARLTNRLGDDRSNVKIEPGMSIPFMVVFSGLPEDLEEFTIEVTGSTSLK